MKKKLLSLALVLALVLSLCPLALAAEIRETDFFEDQPHTELTFSEIEYKHVDAEPILAAMEEIRGLMADAAEERNVATHFDAVTDQVMELMTMYTVANLLVSGDATNETYLTEYMYTVSIYLPVVDGLCALCRDLLASPCAGFLKEQLTEADIEYYSTYEDMTEEEEERFNKENELDLAYQTAALQPFVVEYEGESYDEATVEAAYAAGEVDAATYDAVLTEIVKLQNATLGEIYMEMVALRQEIAKAAGYKNYGDYAYAEVYDRDYTQKTITPFLDAVKDYMVDANDVLSVLANYAALAPAFVQDYTGEDTLDVVEGYLGQMSSELAEPFDYMRTHEMYDLTYSDTKQPVGFTTMLYNYGAPYMFNQPYGMLYDFTTLIHEFGHYNNFYWTPAGWNDSANNIDTAEVHSQGMEVLFSNYYPEIFGDSAASVTDFQIANLAYAIVSACMIGELEQYVYTTPNVTLEQINVHYLELQKAYGVTTEDDPREMAYGWATIPHVYSSPCYYISYAVSASGALAFWLEAQEGAFTDAVDHYLKFVALPAETGFQESFEKLGMANPLSAEYVEDLAAALLVETRAEERLPSLILADTFSDLSGTHWYDEYVFTLAMAGMVTGYDDGTFRPSADITWGQALKLVLELMGESEVAPVEGGNWSSGYRARALELGLIEADVEQNAVITRLEIAQLLCKALGLPASENESPFTDCDDGSAVALSELGILDGFTDAQGVVTFQGEGSLTRAQFCAILYRTIMLAAEEAA